MKCSTLHTLALTKKTSCHILCVLVILFLSLGKAYAKKDPPYLAKLPGDSIAIGKILAVSDTVFFNPTLSPLILRTNSIHNVVSFRINEYSSKVVPDSFKAKLTVKLFYLDKFGTRDSVDNKILTVDYYKSKPYRSKDLFLLQGAYKLEVKILNLEVQYATEAQVMPLLELENRMQPDRDYVMNPVVNGVANTGTNAVKSIQLNTSSIATTGELEINWATNITIESYDVEWTFIDSSALGSGLYYTSGQPDPVKIFRNNATRINTTSISASIPLIYDGGGILFCRVRGVQTDPSGERITTKWSSEYTGTGGLGAYSMSGHERALNWQVTTSFAEEAKRKTVVQYFDGSLRNRQTVTRDNTTGNTVVAETLYDKQGRPVIQVLPAPTLDKLLKFTPGFNAFDANGNEFAKSLYDTIAGQNDYCADTSKALSASSGASRYYSSQNPQAGLGFHQYIPDAEGFVYTETKYTQDNTGQISRQSGVGRTFRMGSGRETRYYYGSAEQKDLDALFGTEAGDATHYQKNMVRDANGQYSVSYVDMQGRTVATAVAGNAPTGLKSLNSAMRVSVKEDILSPESNVRKGTSVISTKSILVPVNGTYSLTYSLGGSSLTMEDCQQRNICYDCLYDLTITITDECGNSSLPNGQPIVFTRSNVNLFSIDTACNEVTPLQLIDSFQLSEGTYNITKELKISEAGMRYYRDSVFLLKNTCKTYAQWLDSTLSKVRASLTCDSALAEKTEVQDFMDELEADMIPQSGQYAEFPVIAGGAFSIFKTNAEGKYYYQTVTDYHDADGNPWSFDVTKLTPQEFIDQFDQAWLKTLVRLHPEYNRVLKFDGYSASHLWADAFAKTETYAAAKQKGYLNPSGTSTRPPASSYGTGGADPLFFGYSESTQAMEAIENKLFNFQALNGVTANLWNVATITAVQSKGEDSLELYLQNSNAFSESRFCEADLDRAWLTFRDIYLTIRKDWIYDKVRTVVPTGQLGEYTVFANSTQVLSSQGLIGNPDTLVSRAQAQAVSQAKLVCEVFANQWWAELTRGCTGFTSTDSAWIIPRLITVCREGADLGHPIGASTVPQSSTYRFKSFDEVVKFYVDSTSKGGSLCSGFLISKPNSYENPGMKTVTQIVRQPDSCQCQKIEQYFSEYLTEQSKYSNFSKFLEVRYMTTISQGALDSLRGLCGNNSLITVCTPNGVNLSLPTLFQCDANVCISCMDVSNGLNAFKNRYPGYTPEYSDTVDTQRIVNVLFTNFMNQRFGFGMSHLNYLTFLDSCTKRGIAANLDSLKKFYDDYNKNTRMGRYEHVFETQEGENFRDMTQLVQNGIVRLPDSVRARAGTWYNNFHFNALGTNINTKRGYTVESNIRVEADTLFGNVFYVHYGLMGMVFSSYPQYLGGGLYLSGLILNAYNGNNGAPVSELGADYGGNGFSYIKVSSDPYAMLKWMKIRVSITPGRYMLFFNDSLVYEGVRDQSYPIADQQGFGFGFRGRHGNVDYIRMGNANDTEMYFEGFDDPARLSSLNTQVSAFPGLACKNNFTYFFNVKFGTNFTFEQIDSLYRENFNEIVDVCSFKQFTEQEAGYADLEYKQEVKLSTVGRGVAGGNAELRTIDDRTSFLGFTVSKTGGTDLALAKFDGFGTLKQLKTYDFVSGDRFSRLFKVNGGNLMMVSMTEDVLSRVNLRLTKVDTNGNVIWSKKIDFNTSSGSMFQQYVNHLVEFPTGGFALIGRVGEIDVNNKLSYLIFDKLGNLVVQKLYKVGEGKFSDFNVVPNGDSVTIVGNYNAGVPGSSFVNRIFKVSVDRYSGVAGIEQKISLNGSDISLIGARYAVAGVEAYVLHPGGTGVMTLAFDGTISSAKLNAGQLNRLFANDDRALIIGKTDISFRNWEILNGWTDRFRASTLALSGSSDYSKIASLGYNGMMLYHAGTDSILRIAKKRLNARGISCDTGRSIPFAGESWNPSIAYTSNTVIVDSIAAIASFSDVPAFYSVDSLLVNQITSTKICVDSVRIAPTGPLRLCDIPMYDSILQTLAPQPACADSTNIATLVTEQLFSFSQDSVKGEFEKAYIEKCMDVMSRETMTLQRDVLEYHYTLYYYDLAGNLVKTVPPEGVKLNRDTAWLREVKEKRALGERKVPGHFMATIYEYNTLNQVIRQTTPDAGVSEFWYDRLGRLAVSQNAQQKLSNRYSYTLYDGIGRIVQVGQKVQTTTATSAITRNASSLWSWLNATYTLNSSTVVAEQVTSTLYDLQDPTMLLSMKIPTQRVSHTLRNRVSTTRYLTTLSAQSPAALADFDAATTYSYDIHGNVDTLVQQYRKGMMAAHGDNRFKVMTYQYDLISGKVNQVHYQPGEPDQYYHRYAYDAENRITDVYTTTNKALIGSDVLEDHEAFYSYYKHGPLARTILGQQQVQGIDYAYTLQGWLKGVNSMALDTAIDMGRDGGGTITARDAYGFQLNYFTGDYKPVNTSRNPFPGHSGYIGAAYRPLYNGNISSMGVNIGKLNQPQLYNYEYDQLNRLVSMQAYRGFNGNSWNGITATTDHQEQISYDGNGNITGYLRNGNTSAGKPLSMDNLSYHYKDSAGIRLSNQLIYVSDAVTNNANYTEDIDGHTDSANYHYDQIGNLTHDTQEKIDSIEWTVYGKISQIWKDNSSTVGDLQRIRYSYDASGNRISKTVYSNQDAGNYKAVHTWYVRDASGNVMATYTSEDIAAKSTLATGTLGKLYLSELHMYGSSRLGIWNRRVDMDEVPASGGTAPLLGSLGIDTFNRGNKFFELANHLGNVLVTVSDRKVGQNPVSGLYTSYTADVVSASDYAPFGMQMVGRMFDAAGAIAYRYGFNGQEKDNEVYGEYNYVNLGERALDTRLGRLNWSIDPLSSEYPWQSPYAYFGNSPILKLDYNGEGDYYGKDGKYLGTDKKKDDLVYTASGIKKIEILDENGKGTGEYKTEFLDAKKLRTTHSAFQKQAATIFGESSAFRTKINSDELKYEMYAIASVFQRNDEAYGATSVQAQIFLKTSLEGRNGTKMQFANAATINAISGGFDFSYGATHWDGQEQAMFPGSNKNFNEILTSKSGKKTSIELHMNTSGWTISNEHYSKWKSNVGSSFQAPQINYTPSGQGKFNKYYIPNAIRLKSTAVYGGTIFWKELKGNSIIRKNGN